jgi:histidyl-tRNA synthetase
VSEGAVKKEERRKFQAIKGTRDLLPPGTALWNRVDETAHEVFASYGFGEIRLPIFEATDLFARAVGGETDIVSKEMYSFEDHSFIELEQLRAGLIMKTISADVPSELTHYEKSVSAYLDILSERMSAGDVPKTPENQSALLKVRTCLSEMNRAGASYFRSQTGTDARAFEKYLRGVKEALRLFRFGDVLSLRPEATASICRAYIENGMQQWLQPVKLYTIGPMFRRERPQKGRYRQFYQIDAEILGGTDAPAIDAEVIEMVMTFFDRLELQGVRLDVNSIGCRDCRSKYVELLRAELLKVKDKLGADSQRRIETNPLRVLDSKLESEQDIIATLPHIADHLCEACATHYAAVKHQLEMRGVFFKENWRLVRGLDYYMRTTFEITAQGLGSQNAVCGGGRYDGLVELLGGPPTKGIGFAIGEDRLILSLQDQAKNKEVASGEWRVASEKPRVEVYVAWMGEKAYATAIRAAKDLRKAGFSVELPPVEQKFGKALGQADKLGARYALILGDNEVAEGLWTLKTLADGTQAKFTEGGLLEHLRKARGV